MVVVSVAAPALLALLSQYVIGAGAGAGAGEAGRSVTVVNIGCGVMAGQRATSHLLPLLPSSANTSWLHCTQDTAAIIVHPLHPSDAMQYHPVYL